MRLSPKILGLAGLLLLVAGGFVLWRGGTQNRSYVSEESGSIRTSTADSGVQEGVAPVATGSDDWKGLDDPSRDGWDTEVLHELLKKKLDGLSKVVVSGEGGEEEVRELADTEIEVSELVLSGLDPVWSAGGVTVKRGNPAAGVSLRGLEGFASAVQMIQKSLGGNAGTRRCVFKVIALESGQTGVRGRVSVECARIDQGGVVEQHAEWMTTWKATAAGDDLKLVEVVLERFEQSEGRKRIFADCTESVLASNDSYEQQIMRGYPYWLQRIQDTRQMTLLGTPGTALGDVNGDGLEDLYLCQAGGVPNRLYLQRLDGTLQDFTEESGAGWLESSRSALLVDLDNDGDQDLVVVSYARVVIGRNDGQGRFKVAAVIEAGIGAMGIASADYDGDGDLDLYVCHYSKGDLEFEAGATVIGSGGQFVYHDANNGGRNYLYRNDGGEENWIFADVTTEVGLDVNNRRFSLAAAWEDFDNDGDQDLYVANDFGRNNLYRNEGGRFMDVAPQLQGEDRASGMSVSWGDVNRDGWMDLYVANMFSAAGRRIAPQEAFSPGSSNEIRQALLRFARGNTLLLQDEGRFRDESEELGVTMGRWAWSSMFADINSDGWDDLLVANGYITTPDPGDL